MLDGRRRVLIDALFMAMKRDVQLVPEFCIRVIDGYDHPDMQANNGPVSTDRSDS